MENAISAAPAFYVGIEPDLADSLRSRLPLRTAKAGDVPRAQHVLHRDYETRGTVVLEVTGTFEYARHPDTKVLCCAYAVDNDAVQLWRPGDPIPIAFLEAAQDPGWIAVAHNVSFELAVEKFIMAPRYQWPEIPLSRHCDTMSMALACGLPGRLSTLAAISGEAT
jgi:DNA polymerase